MGKVAGLDGARGGWAAVIWDSQHSAFETRFVKTASEILFNSEFQLICVDTPIGLLSAAKPGGRECDRLARKLLGKGKAASVFTPPVRRAVYAPDYPSALELNRASSSFQIGISKQSYNICNKIREVDELMDERLQCRVREAHPELVFMELNQGAPVMENKKTPEGKRIRRELLANAGFSTDELLQFDVKKSQAAEDDIIDAAAVCTAAMRWANGQLKRVPEAPDRDDRNLIMEIVY